MFLQRLKKQKIATSPTLWEFAKNKRRVAIDINSGVARINSDGSGLCTARPK